jgi:curved DNA-binding protein CbpA
MNDLYGVLELARGAPAEEIKANYRRLAMKWHPDRNGGSREAEERFKLISEAYAVLSDESKRRDYDAYLDGGGSAAPGRAASGAYGPAGGNAQDPFGFGGFSGIDPEAFAGAFAEAFGFAGFSGFSFFSKEEASSMFMREMQELASELTMRNVGWREIAGELERRGCPAEAASSIAFQVEERRKAAIRGNARGAFVRAALSGLFGLVLLRGFGGFGLGLFGLAGLVMLLSGAYNLVRALYFLATGNAPRRIA